MVCTRLIQSIAGSRPGCCSSGKQRRFRNLCQKQEKGLRGDRDTVIWDRLERGCESRGLAQGAQIYCRLGKLPGGDAIILCFVKHAQR